jgi:hypothetical protein
LKAETEEKEKRKKRRKQGRVFPAFLERCSFPLFPDRLERSYGMASKERAENSADC